MSDSRIHLEGYLRDSLAELKLLLKEAKEAPDVGSSDDRAFSSGRAMGLYEALSVMRDQAVAFGVDLRLLGLDKGASDAALLRPPAKR